MLRCNVAQISESGVPQVSNLPVRTLRARCRLGGYSRLRRLRDVFVVAHLLLFLYGITSRAQLLDPPASTPPQVSLPAFLALKGYSNAPAAPGPTGYIGSSSCAECHRDEHASWHRSYHRTMTQPMTAETVIGNFNGTVIESSGYRYRVYREGDQFFSEGPDPDLLMYWVMGKKQDPPATLPRVRLPVVMATGSHHYQTYWVPSPRHPGVLQTLPLVFLRETQQWSPREAAFLHGPDDRERLVTQWNHHCIICHSTGGNPGLDEPSGALRTQVAELGISCEACHGPMAGHVAYRRARANAPRPEKDPVVNPKKLNSKRSSEICGQCHGVFINRDEFAMEFAKHGIQFRPGEEVERTRYYPRHPKPGSPLEAWADLKRNPQFFRERWWPDGQMLAGGREFSAMRESACYEKGELSCLNCHSMHASDPDDQLRRDRPGSAACVECHREPQYSTDVGKHTHHAPGSTGSDCLNCHMPFTSYALFKGIRNHQISSPRVAPLAAGGPPNACNLCHIDRTLDWAQESLAKWFGRKPVSLDEKDRDISAVARWLIEGHAAQRIIAAWHFGWEPAMKTGGGDWIKPLLSLTLADDYGAVRFVAARSLRSQPRTGRFEFDFLASQSERRTVADQLLKQFLTNTPAASNPRTDRFEDASGKLDRTRLTEMLKRQDRRSVTVKE